MALHEQTISHILKQLADEYSSVVSERELCERVLQQRPSQCPTICQLRSRTTTVLKAATATAALKTALG